MAEAVEVVYEEPDEQSGGVCRVSAVERVVLFNGCADGSSVSPQHRRRGRAFTRPSLLLLYGRAEIVESFKPNTCGCSCEGRSVIFSQAGLLVYDFG